MIHILHVSLVLSNTASQRYNGTRNTTISGLPCQSWIDDMNHHPNDYPDNTLTENYCRDPYGRGYIWCYTPKPSVPYEMCLQGKQS
jgi:hypothetical protein